MSPSRTRTPLGRLLVAGVCGVALVAGPAVGTASADDKSLAKTITERAQQLDKREKALRVTLKALASKPSQSRAKAAAKDSGGLYRTTNAFRTEVRDDDGSTDKGVATRDAVLPKLTTMSTSAKKLDALLQAAAKKRTVTTQQVKRITAAKLVLDQSIGKVVASIGEAFADDGPIDPAPAPTDPTE